MNNQIKVTFDAKTKRLVCLAPFHMVDVLRGWPSRRFDAKSKTWRMALVKANIKHLENTRHLYEYQIDEAADEAIKNFAALVAAPIRVPFPYHLHDFKKAKVPYEPMAHQSRMLDMAWNLKSCAWFAKMGTGKTFAAIHLAMARWASGQIDAVMVICPSTLRATWEKELAKFATYEYDYRYHATKAPWLKAFYAERPRYPKEPLPILAVSVEGLGVSESLYDSACGFMVGRRVLVICDESSRIKNPDAKRTQRAIMLGSAAEYRMILNGTPLALGIQDTWAQYEFLDPNIIGTGDYWAFRTRYLVMGGFEQKEIVGIQNMDELMPALLPYTIEVGKDVLGLPEKMLTERTVQITAMQRRLIRSVVKANGTDPELPMMKVTNSLEKVLRCRQIVGGWLPKARVEKHIVDGVEVEITKTDMVPLDENPKMDAMFDLFEDNYAGSKFIVWTTFIHEVEAIRDRLVAKYGSAAVECYYGSTAMEDRSRIEDRYCRDPKMRFFVANPATAGLGLTLISGENDVMVYYSGTNAYIDRAQSEDRSHRLGQHNAVAVVDMVADKTVDNLIVASIREKMSIEEYFLAQVKKGTNLDKLLLGEE